MLTILEVKELLFHYTLNWISMGLMETKKITVQANGEMLAFLIGQYSSITCVLISRWGSY